MGILLTFFAFIVTSFFGLMAFAEGFPIPEAQISDILKQIATDWSTLGTFGILSLLTLLTVQVLKLFIPAANNYKRLTVTAASVLYSVLNGLMTEGSDLVTVLLSVLITSGGAVATYEAFRGTGILGKK